MTLAAVKKLTSQLTTAQKAKLANDLFVEIAPRIRPALSLNQLEQRAADVASGRVKAISGEVFDANLEYGFCEPIDYRESLTSAELDRRAEEMESGKVKGIPSEVIHAAARLRAGLVKSAA